MVTTRVTAVLSVLLAAVPIATAQHNYTPAPPLPDQASLKNISSTKYSVFKHGKAWYHIVIADVSDTRITPTAYYSPRLTNFWNIAGNVQPVAAITGTFFAWENQQPVADVIIDGEKKASGKRGSVLAVDWYGRVKIINVPVKQDFDHTPYRYALRGMIRVVDKGIVKPNPRAQGFRDSSIWGRAPRTAVGITKAGKLALIATSKPITLSELGNALKSQGCVDGVSLDGGGSTMLYYNGKVKLSTGRPMSTVFMVEKRDPFDEKFSKHLRRLGLNQAKGAARPVLPPSLF